MLVNYQTATTTTIVDHISWSKYDNFSCYFSTNSRENPTTNLLVFLPSASWRVLRITKPWRPILVPGSSICQSNLVRRFFYVVRENAHCADVIIITQEEDRVKSKSCCDALAPDLLAVSGGTRVVPIDVKMSWFIVCAGHFFFSQFRNCSLV